MRRLSRAQVPLLCCSIGCLALIGLATLLSNGCTKFEEAYHVGVLQKGSGQPLQFYRFRLEGWATPGSKTQFESGWYPAEALQATVGEYRRSQLPETSGHFVPPIEVLHEAGKTRLGTTRDRIDVRPKEGQPLKVQFRQSVFRFPNLVALPMAAIGTLKWSNVEFNATLVSKGQGDENNATPDPNKDKFKITLQGGVATCSASEFANAIRNISDAVEYMDGSLDVENIMSIEVSEIDAHLEVDDPKQWSEEGSFTKTSNIRRLSATGATYRWSVEGDVNTTLTFRVLRAEAPPGASRFIGRIANTRVTQPERLSMSAGWSLKAPAMTLAVSSGSTNQEVRLLGLTGETTVIRSELENWLEAVGRASLVTMKDIGDTQIFRRSFVPPSEVFMRSPSNSNSATETVVRAGRGVLTGTFEFSNPGGGLYRDFQLEFLQPKERIAAIDPHGFEYWVFGPEGARKSLVDQRLVVFMAADPSPVTSAIQSFARSEEVQAVLMELVKRSRENEGKEQARFARLAIKTGLTILRKHVEAMDPAGTADVVNEAVQGINNLADAD